MSIVKGNPELDFFDQNPTLRVKAEYQNLLKKYPKIASKIAWSVFLIEDNTKSNALRNMSKADRTEEVKANYYNIDIEEHKDLLRLYPLLCMSREETMYKIHQEKMDEVTAHLRELSLDDESGFNKTIKILSNVGKMWDALSKAYTKLSESESKVAIRGNITESYREKRNRI